MSSGSQVNGDPRAVSLSLSVGWNVLGTPSQPHRDRPRRARAGGADHRRAGPLRYRRGDERVKRQVQWLLLALLVIHPVVNSQRWVTGSPGRILLLLTFAAHPDRDRRGRGAARAVRHQVRACPGRCCTPQTVAVVVAAFAGLVTVLSTVVSERALSPGVPTGAALAVAITFNPLRIRLHHASSTGRSTVGRSDPAGTARDVGEQLAAGRRARRPVIDRARSRCGCRG